MQICLQIAADGISETWVEDKSFTVGCAPADAGALQTCLVIQGFPGSIKEARDQDLGQTTSVGTGTAGTERKQEAGEVIICVEVLSRTLEGRED